MSVNREPQDAATELIDELTAFLSRSATLFQQVEDHLTRTHIQSRFDPTREPRDTRRPGWRCQATVDSRLPAVRVTMHGVQPPQRHPQESDALYSQTCNALHAARLARLGRSLAWHFHIVGELAPCPYDQETRWLQALLVFRMSDLD